MISTCIINKPKSLFPLFIDKVILAPVNPTIISNIIILRLMKKIRFRYLILASIVFISYSCSTIKEDNLWKVFSPDGSIKVAITLDSMGTPVYSVFLNGKLIVFPSKLGIGLEEEALMFTKSLSFIEEKDSEIHDSYTSRTGKRSSHSYHAKEKTLTFNNESGNIIDIIFQISNNGVAFRYQLYNDTKSTVNLETSEFCLSEESLSWIQGFKSPFNDYEMFYTKRQLDTMQLPEYYMPSLFQTPENTWIIISDASVNGNYAACQLVHTGKGRIAIKFPDQYFKIEEWMKGFWYEITNNESLKIKASRNLLTPWRVMIISDNLEHIVESALIENLSSPSVIDDQSWIEPGVAVFPWWGNSTANDEPEILKDYIDLANEMNWKYLEFDIGLLSNNGGYAAEFWRNIDYIPEIIDYATSRGIKVYGWDERRNLDTPEKRDDIFGKYREWGVAGIKMDFINSDKQEAMKWYDEATSQAAEYNLLVSFHGAITPRGLQRTFPNIMTYEGVRGAEYYKFAADNEIPDPVHNCTLPFTRNISGPMDYTPTTFSTPRRKSTYAHELALPFIFESGWICMADKPEEFRKCPAKELLQNLHAAWDDIHFIDGYPGEFCCLARRKGEDWFIAAINSEISREIEINFKFLSENNYDATIYTDDGKDGLLINDFFVLKSNAMTFSLARNGGFVIHIIPVRN